MQWQTYSGDHPVSGRWGIHFDGSWREMSRAEWQQWLVRPGVNMEIDPSTQLSFTYSYFKAHPAGVEWDVKSQPEHRVHQQIQKSHGSGRVAFRHRIRAEQRYFGTEFERKNLEPGWMQHRFRYLVGGQIPLATRDDRGTVTYLSVYNELMLRFRNAGVSAFEQDRIYAGVGVRPARYWNIETGVFYQRMQPIYGGGMENNFVLFTTVSNTMPLRELFRR